MFEQMSGYHSLVKLHIKLTITPGILLQLQNFRPCQTLTLSNPQKACFPTITSPPFFDAD